MWVEALLDTPVTVAMATQNYSVQVSCFSWCHTCNHKHTHLQRHETPLTHWLNTVTLKCALVWTHCCSEYRGSGWKYVKMLHEMLHLPKKTCGPTGTAGYTEREHHRRREGQWANSSSKGDVTSNHTPQNKPTTSNDRCYNKHVLKENMYQYIWICRNVRHPPREITNPQQVLV